MLDSAGELGWQLERAGLSGDGAGVAVCGDSGSPFSTLKPCWQVGEAPGLRALLTSAGPLQEKQRKCYNEPKVTAYNGMHTPGAARRKGENSLTIFGSTLHNTDLAATSAARNLCGPEGGPLPPLGATGARDRVESGSS